METFVDYIMYVVFSKKLNEESVNVVIEKFSGIIKSNGNIEDIDNWGKKKFAYPISKEDEGFYFSIKFRSSSNVPAELNRVSHITDGVLRVLIVKKNMEEG